LTPFFRKKLISEKSRSAHTEVAYSFKLQFFLLYSDKTVAPCGSNELERLSHAGLEALIMQVQDDYHLREGEDQLYLDATKPIGFAPQTPARRCLAVAARDASG
jgi:hypothetical protein